ncbi:highly immunogenic outer capsid protein [Aeromonas phage avDM14-QBC]|nr:highly immunogenic outer capsid protein [Aeromonas phage avDM14-QBC]UYD58603.1 highly immunogenic outer capsid protein [Aeromonas phage avDM10-HWA]UYD58851.1 highly immunogenic outer capsid protein [Aeromonas phage avDM10-HWA]UYD59094.1 highly immunogenic outer capsid protein [Aeromonas phage avDM7-IJDJ]
MAITFTLTPMSQTVPVDGKVVFTAEFMGDDTVKEVVGYAWSVDGSVVPSETANTFTKTFDTARSISVKCEVTYGLVADDGADPQTMSETATITVEEVPVVPEGHWFVHPLAFKNSSFSWVPYWIHDWMKANPNWRTDPASSPWPAVTYAIDLAVTTYGECLMQESRNGYIYKASAYTK